MRVQEIKITKNLSVNKLIELIETANKYESDIFLKGKDFNINAKSIMGVISVIKAGTEVMVLARGEDEESALREVGQLLMELT